MNRPLFLALTGLAICGATYFTYEGLVLRIERLEGTRIEPAELQALRKELNENSKHIASALAALERLRTTPQQTETLDARIRELAGELQEASVTLNEQDARLAQWEKARDEYGPRALDARLEGYQSDIQERFKHIDQIAKEALGLARGTLTEVERVESDLARDPERMWRELLGPTVQLMGEETVGSGVLLPSEPYGAPGEYRTLLITAWHVVRDIQAGPERLFEPVPVTVYGQDKTITAESALLLEHDVEADLALLRLETTRKLNCGVRLASRERLERVRIFDQVYAVGCPLGNDPIPTFGEIADTQHAVDGQRYWMLSAPTYIGNSGGGIFDARTHELLGIFSKIYTHGSIRPTVVPHMGLATSMLVVYDWFDKVGYAGLEPRPSDPVAHAAAAETGASEPQPQAKTANR
jgi:hypothetical protein